MKNQTRPTAAYRFACLLRRFQIEANSSQEQAAQRTEKRMIRLVKSEPVPINLLSRMMGIVARWHVTKAMPKRRNTESGRTKFKDAMMEWMDSVMEKPDPKKWQVEVNGLGDFITANIIEISGSEDGTDLQLTALDEIVTEAKNEGVLTINRIAADGSKTVQEVPIENVMIQPEVGGVPFEPAVPLSVLLND